MKHWIRTLIPLSLSLLAACSGPEQASNSRSLGGAQIMGGSVVDTKEAWARALVLIEASDGSNCTGALIRHDVVLTASHCVEIVDENDQPARLKVLIRKADGDGFDEFATRTLRSHEDYALTKSGAFNDIALIRLQGSADTSIRILPVATSMATAGRRDAKLLAVGYGKTKDAFVPEATERILRSVPVALAIKFGRQSIPDGRYSDKNDILIVDQHSRRGICSGDSGGPLLHKTESGGYEVIAVANTVTNPLDQRAPCAGYGTYQSAVFHKDWLEIALRDFADEDRARAGAGAQ